MELKRYLEILRKDIKSLLFLVFVFLIGGFVYYQITPISYEVSLDLAITQKGAEEAGEYRYDNLDRLQASELFANDAVWLLGSRRISDEICQKANISSCLDRYDARRVSTQFLQVKFSLRSQKEAQNISTAIVAVLNDEAEKLNRDGRNDWFEVLGNDPTISMIKISCAKIFLGTLALGFFFGFWVVLLRHYFSR